ncbi:type II toxin-antitoxin system death-on-curing family toxin [Janthinobacterium sp. GB4P2]|uniref:type II toxin-antitoxin system death-on-curing family toxin n=1 Tax=Janthinobacterium sp. GB4P2 TaxID=3424189 RepID=UPI003F24191E
MRLWRWVSASLVYAVHDMQLARHGGLAGLRDKNAVESAVGRAQQLATYGEPAPDAADLAAAYAFGLARNHGFSDGNKRTAWVVARVFLVDNGEGLDFTEIDAIRLMQNVAAGNITEQELAQWFRLRLASTVR